MRVGTSYTKNAVVYISNQDQGVKRVEIIRIDTYPCARPTPGFSSHRKDQTLSPPPPHQSETKERQEDDYCPKRDSNPQLPDPVSGALISQSQPPLLLLLGVARYIIASPRWGAADAEIKVPSGQNTELKRSPFKAWSRSVYSHICYAYCQGFLPCLFLPFWSIHLHFFQKLSQIFLCWLWLTHGSCVGPQNEIGLPVRRQVQVLSACGI